MQNLDVIKCYIKTQNPLKKWKVNGLIISVLSPVCISE